MLRTFFSVGCVGGVLLCAAPGQIQAGAQPLGQDQSQDQREVQPQAPDPAQEVDTLTARFARLFAEDKFDEAAPLAEQALALGERLWGSDSPEAADLLHNLALVQFARFRRSEAAALQQRALAITEKAFGRDSPEVWKPLYSLALVSYAEGRHAEAVPLYRRALAAAEAAPQPVPGQLAATLNDLAQTYQALGRQDLAEPLMQRSLAIREQALGPEHPHVAESLNNLALARLALRRFAEAEPLLKRALAIREQKNGPDHPSLETPLNNLASLYMLTERPAEAEQSLRRALAIVEKSLGPDHPKVSMLLSNLGTVCSLQGRHAEAEPLLERSAEIARVRFGEDDARFGDRLQTLAALHSDRGDWTRALDFWRRSANIEVRRLKREARRNGVGFEKAQVEERARLFRRLIRTAARVSGPGLGRGNDLAREMFTAAQWASAGKETALTPLSVDEAQALLRPDEALMLFVDTAEARPRPEETYIWTITKSGARWTRSALGAEALKREVGALLRGLDPAPGGAPFDPERAHRLYRELFAGTEDLIAGKSLLLAPSGALTRLPFQTLLTAPFKGGGGYRGAPWLIRDHALTVLPAVSSLKTLRGGGRAFFRAEAARRAMLELIDNGPPHEAPPAFWAPFVVAGEDAF